MKKILPVAGGLFFIVLGAGLFYLSGRSYSQADTVQKVTSEDLMLPTKAEASVSPTVATVADMITLAPSISMNITVPKDKQTVASSRLTVKGTTLPEADVFVNENYVTADRRGNFSSVITLEEGENFILVSANDESGNSAEKELTVVYNP